MAHCRSLLVTVRTKSFDKAEDSNQLRVPPNMQVSDRIVIQVSVSAVPVVESARSCGNPTKSIVLPKKCNQFRANSGLSGYAQRPRDRRHIILQLSFKPRKERSGIAHRSAGSKVRQGSVTRKCVTSRKLVFIEDNRGLRPKHEKLITYCLWSQ